jgi:cytochrome c oxidase subunit 1
MDVTPRLLDGVPMPDLMPPEVEEENYLNAEYGVRSWLLTRDHKRIGLLYLFTLTGMFVLGGLAAL